VTLVDDEDFDALSRSKWHVCGSSPKRRYAAHAFVQGFAPSKMHRHLLGALPGRIVDHIDGDGLNNQRSNLRFASTAENARNTAGHEIRASRYKGVSLIVSRGVWTARIMTDGKRLTLGRFRHQEEAALAYDAAARQHHGSFARCNYPDES